MVSTKYPILVSTYPDESIQNSYNLDEDGERRSRELRLFSKNLPPTPPKKGHVPEGYVPYRRVKEIVKWDIPQLTRPFT
jgi:hypothetical protein